MVWVTASGVVAAVAGESGYVLVVSKEISQPACDVIDALYNHIRVSSGLFGFCGRESLFIEEQALALPRPTFVRSADLNPVPESFLDDLREVRFF